MIKELTYTLKSGCIKSCRRNANEIQVGEQVYFYLDKAQIPALPERIVAVVLKVQEGNALSDYHRQYTFQYDDAPIVAAGVAFLETTNLLEAPSCISCCDILDEKVTALQGGSGALAGRVTVTETSITALQAADTALAGRVTTAETGITALQAADVSLLGRVVASETDIDALQAADTALAGRVTTAETGITALQAADTALAGRVTTAETGITALQAADTALAGRVTTAETGITALQAADTALAGRVTTAETGITALQAADTALAGRVTTAETGITALQAADTALAGRVTTAETGITALQSGKANLAGGNIISGPQQNSGQVFSSAALGTDLNQLPTQQQVFSRQNSNNTAYVSATFGSDALAVVGAPMRPYATVSAAINSAATQVCLLENATLGGTGYNKNIFIILNNNATLTITSRIATASNTQTLTILGDGNILCNAPGGFLNPFPNDGGPCKVFIDISGTVTAGSNSFLFESTYGFLYKLNCSKVVSLCQSPSGLTAVFNNTSNHLGIEFGPDVRFFSGTGTAPLFSVGGTGGYPRMSFADGCMVWHNGAQIFSVANGASIVAPRIYTGGTGATATVPTVIGSLTSPAWLSAAIVNF